MVDLQNPLPIAARCSWTFCYSCRVGYKGYNMLQPQEGYKVFGILSRFL